MLTRSIWTTYWLVLLLLGCSERGAWVAYDETTDQAAGPVSDEAWVEPPHDADDGGSAVVEEASFHDGGPRFTDGGVVFQDGGPTLLDAGSVLSEAADDPDCIHLCEDIKALECELVVPSGERFACPHFCPDLFPSDRRCLDAAATCEEVKKCLESSNLRGPNG